MQDLRVGIKKIIALDRIEGGIARASAWIALGVLAAHWILVLRFVIVRAHNLSFLRLHYNVAFGIDWFDRWWLIFTFPLFGLLFFCVNLWLAMTLERIRPAFGTLLHVATAILEIALAAAGAIAILLNS